MSYGTLRLDAPAPAAQSKSRKVAYLAAAMALVGLAATAAVVGSAQVNSAVFATPYDAKAGDIEYCNVNNPGYAERVPKYDPALSKPAGFYNACYFAFRCCTTTGNGNGCYVSDNFGSECRRCLQGHPPKVLKDKCKEYVADYKTGKMSKDEEFTQADMMAGKLPPIKSLEDKKSTLYAEKYAVAVNKKDFACWVQPGDKDDRKSKFGDNCFEVLSWCNLLCPRDAANSVGHVMCKHCTLLGFQRERPANVPAYQDKNLLHNWVAVKPHQPKA